MKEVKEFIRNANNIAVITHINPDGDALGSAFALNYMLQKMGKTSMVVLNTPPPFKYVMQGFEYLLYENINPKDYKRVICVDCASYPRLGNAKELLDSLRSLNIDHHISNTGYCDVNYIKQSSSTGELIFEILEHFNMEVDSTVAVPIYIAIATDTGIFTYSNTTKHTFETVSKLVATGFDISTVADRVFNSRSLGGTKLIARFIENIRFHHNNKLAISILTLQDLADCDAKLEDCETVINFARDIESVEIAAFIREVEEGAYKVSLRSKSYVDVADFASRFGGGGHKRASGFLVKDSIFEVIETVIKTSKDYL